MSSAMRLEAHDGPDLGVREPSQRVQVEQRVGAEARVHQEHPQARLGQQRGRDRIGCQGAPAGQVGVTARVRRKPQQRRAPAPHGDAQLRVPTGDRRRAVRFGEHREEAGSVEAVADDRVDVVVNEARVGRSRRRPRGPARRWRLREACPAGSVPARGRARGRARGFRSHPRGAARPRTRWPPGAARP